MNQAQWTNGKATLTGTYTWLWAEQRFVVSLDRAVGFAGERRKRLVLSGDVPEWGRWKLAKDPQA